MEEQSTGFVKALLIHGLPESRVAGGWRTFCRQITRLALFPSSLSLFFFFLILNHFFS